MKFRMVDRILCWAPWRLIRGVKAVSFEEYCLKSAFGGPEHLPESLVVESLFQLGNWLIVLSSDFARMGLVIRFEAVEFFDQVRPGQSLICQAEIRSRRDDGILFDGVAWVGDRPVARGRGCLAVPVDLADYLDPADLRVLFSEIHRPERSGDEGA